MRKINVIEFVSLDGVIEAPGGPEAGYAHGGWFWPFIDDELSAKMAEGREKSFDLLVGRRTFEIWAPFWPQHNDMWPAVNVATKYVASRTISSHEWKPNVFLSVDIGAQVAEIKQTEGPDLHVFGSSELVQTLMEHDLVDAFWLTIIPVTLGSGKRLFGGGTIPASFKLSESSVTPSGVIIVNYERSGVLQTGGR